MSASGGAFSAIAESCFDTHPKCVVFGAAWVENNKVQHIAVERKEELYLLRKSKYVQSEIGDAYIKCKKYLNDGFFVVFSGTPCQIAGLKSYLDKDYDSLLTIDIVCHGTPPAWVLESYVNSIEKRYGQKVKNITFRYKKKDLLGTTQSRNIVIDFSNKNLVAS
ncbi:MAG: Coenzyme F420 hydrogenase/dehydrogenase, beta subunit C-terminal domain, partial [Bacteroides thetaiotaomicron]|nr:Coenzyme F420 hydrogenase/dehydrogenase, beta subunit C-terminal domain [Bacteroides thetaiotaomicron]